VKERQPSLAEYLGKKALSERAELFDSYPFEYRETIAICWYKKYADMIQL
jgi:hypothetical protein